MQSAKCKTKRLGLEARRPFRTVAAVCGEDRQIDQRTSGESVGPACGGTVGSRGHCTTAQLRRSPCSGESGRFHPQAEHCFERTSRIARLASVHHSGRVVEACIGSAASGRMRGTFSHHWEIHRHGEDRRDEASHSQPGKCKMINAKCKVQNETERRDSLGFALCILHFALTTSPLRK